MYNYYLYHLTLSTYDTNNDNEYNTYYICCIETFYLPKSLPILGNNLIMNYYFNISLYKYIIVIQTLYASREIEKSIADYTLDIYLK